MCVHVYRRGVSRSTATGFIMLGLCLLVAGTECSTTADMGTGVCDAEDAKLTPADVTSRLFEEGGPVSISGDTVVIGSDGEAAYVFVRGDSTWTQQAKLTVADLGRFGISASVDGDTVVIGAASDLEACPGDPSPLAFGSAYVFVRDGTTWTQQVKLTACDVALGLTFGRSVSINGDTAVIAATNPFSGMGMVLVYVRDGTTWTQQANLTVSGVASFGRSVSISGDTTVIGAGRDSGSAYVFVREGTTWTQQAKLTASDVAEDNWFGTSVSVNGDTAVIGAGRDSGSAYVFVREGTTWTEQATLTASDAPDNFGHSVSVSNGTTVIGGATFDDEQGTEFWSAYVFSCLEELQP